MAALGWLSGKVFKHCRMEYVICYIYWCYILRIKVGYVIIF